MKNKLRGSISLLLATIIWGSAFIAQSVGMDYIGPFTFLAVRCALAVVFLLVVIFFFDLKKKDGKRYTDRWKDARLWKTGILCGCALFMGSGLQQIGIQYTDAGKAGFITAMYIVLVPLCGLFLKKKPPFSALISVVLAVIGLYLLSCFGVSEINKGDLYLMGCALAFAVQITLIDELAKDLDGLRINCIQSLVSCILGTVFMFLTETPQLSSILTCWLPICYAGILSSGVAFSLQIIGQKDLEPTTASLIMSLESVFAVICGWLLLHETLTTPELLGCLLVFAAVILSQLPVPKKKAHD